MSVHTLPNGKHIVVWYEGSGEDRRQKRKTFGSGPAAYLRAVTYDKELKEYRGKARPAQPGMSVEDVCHEYYERHTVAEKTHLNHWYKFTRHLVPALGKIPADLLATRDLDLYVKNRLDGGIKRTTISSEIRLLKAVYSWCQAQDPPLIYRNGIARYKVKTLADVDSIPVPPTVKELQRIMSHAEPHLVRAIMIHWHTGIRPGGELRALKWEDVDFVNRELRIRSAHKGGPSIRLIPIHPDLQGKLQRWLEEDKERAGDNVWSLAVVSWSGHPVQSLKRAWAMAKKRAGITRRIRLYDLRHAFATGTLRAGGDLKAVSEVLGHSRPDTTLRIYQHVTRDQHRNVVGLMPKVAPSNKQ